MLSNGVVVKDMWKSLSVLGECDEPHIQEAFADVKAS